jgi:hypothetical protein
MKYIKTFNEAKSHKDDEKVEYLSTNGYKLAFPITLFYQFDKDVTKRLDDSMRRDKNSTLESTAKGKIEYIEKLAKKSNLKIKKSSSSSHLFINVIFKTKDEHSKWVKDCKYKATSKEEFKK